MLALVVYTEAHKVCVKPPLCVFLHSESAFQEERHNVWRRVLTSTVTYNIRLIGNTNTQVCCFKNGR